MSDIELRELIASLAIDRKREAAERRQEAAERRQEAAERRKEAAERRKRIEEEAAERRKRIEEEAAERRKRIEEEAAERRKRIEEEAAERRKEAAERKQRIEEEAAERRQEAAERRKEAAERRKATAAREQFNRQMDERHEKFKREMQEFERKTQEQEAEHNRQREKDHENSMQELEKIRKTLESTSTQLGGSENNKGLVTEEFFVQAFEKTKQIGNIHFEHVRPRLKIPYMKSGTVEIDILMHNTIYCAVIEVKYKCHLNDITKFYNRRDSILAVLPRPEFTATKYIYGMASNFFDEDCVELAHGYGIALITPAGQDLHIDTSHIQEYDGQNRLLL